MRRRLVVLTVAAVVGTLVVVIVPFAIVTARLIRADAVAALRGEAEAIATALADDLAADRPVTTARLASLVPPGERLVLVTRTGTVVEAARGPVEEPVISAEVVAVARTIVRVETSAAPVNERIRTALARLALFGFFAALAAALVAAVQARRMTRPLDDVAAAAARLGAGDFSGAAPRSGMAEVDTIADALDASAERIGALVRAERDFSANVSHQLRSAITGLRLRLEAIEAAASAGGGAADTSLEATGAPADTSSEATGDAGTIAHGVRAEIVEDVRAAIAQADRLTTTLEELLRLARTGRSSEAVRFDVGDLARERVDAVLPRLRGEGREAALDVVGTHTATGAPGAIGQALDVLLDNAIRHGAGRVTVRVEAGAEGAYTFVTVSDEGSGVDPDVLGPVRDAAQATESTQAARPGAETGPDAAGARGHGIGLRLARTLVEADGGRIDVVSTRPAAFRLTVPRA